MRSSLIILFLCGMSVTLLPAQRSGSNSTSKPAPSSAQKSSRPPATQQRSGNANTGSRTSRAATRSTPAYPAPNPQAPSTLTPTAAERTTGSGTAAAEQRSKGNTNTPKATDQRATTTALPPTPTPGTKGGTTPPSTVSAVPVAVEPAAVESAKVLAVNWMSIEEALEKNKTEKRKIFIDVYTDWCGWCKKMDATTFTDPKVVKYLNDNFYAVKFNAEQKSDITFNGKTYHFTKVGNRGYHELAAEWLNNRMSYPTSVYLDEDQKLIQPLPGYLDAAKFEPIITYFGTNSYKRTPWETYERNFTVNRKP